MCLVDDRAYVATDEGLAIVDISKPAVPRELGQVAVPAANLGVQVQGRYAFLANRSQGLVVVDVSNTAAPTVVASLPVSKCWSVALKDKVAYALSLSGSLHVVDVSNPAEPREVLRFGLPAWRPSDYNHKPASAAQEADYLAALQSNSAKGNNYKTGVARQRQPAGGRGLGVRPDLSLRRERRRQAGFQGNAFRPLSAPGRHVRRLALRLRRL